jgi:uncharacterized protein YhjY with autotransporter beta-barrel domain
MKLSNRHIVLLTGASVSALGVASPAMAATTTAPGISHIVAPAAVVSDTLTICDLDDTCVFGVTATNSPSAMATVSDPASGQIEQRASGVDIDLSMLNLGDAEIGAHASATGALAIADAIIDTAIIQQATADDGLVLDFSNSGSLLVDATAIATGDDVSALASAAGGIVQLGVAGGDAALSIANDGALTVAASATATGDTAAYAHGFVAAIDQTATGANVAVSVDNSGTIALDALANAHGATAATAIASVYTGIYQNGVATSSANLSIDNSGTFSALASANAVADSGKASASAHVYGLSQSATGGTASVATVDNSGTINIDLIANASGASSAVVHAFGNAVYQVVGAGTASYSNSGSLSIHASDTAIATGHGFAAATALGVAQSVSGGIGFYSNAGTSDVGAHALVSAASGSAFAYARGYADKGTAATLDVTNAGTIDVAASATAPDVVRALAVGMYLSAAATTVPTTATPATQSAVLTGTVVNSGTLHVAALANGGGSFTTVTTGTAGVVTTHPGSSATATGIYINSGINNLAVTNSGTISVDAITTNGAPALAYGVHVLGTGGGVAAADTDVFTFTNDGGDIIVRESDDGGATFHRGMAIDVSAAPNNSVINLFGDGNIYGDIEVQAGDEINVQSGTTYFDGVINPSAMPAGGIVAADFDTGLAGVGTLTINNGGNLVLADPRLSGDPASYDGPAYAFVDTLTVGADGTLTYELQPATTGVQPAGSYPQIFANTANLAGTLVADIPNTGLFADSYSWDNIIDANTLNGTFDQCVVPGYGGSLLLDVTCSYDANANVDLAIDRVAFNEVAGLNGNGSAVGTGLECIYDVGVTGGLADMFGDLFLITDAANYNIALNQLSGSSYANYLNSFPSLGVHYNDVVDHATNCEVPALAGSVLECRASSPIHVWGQLDYQWRKVDGDGEAGDAKSKRFTGLLGIDATVGNAAILGIDGGYVTNSFRDSQFGDKLKGDGWQVGAYAVYDPGPFFLKGVTTYSSMNGNSTRHVNFAGLGTGTSFAGTLTGSPDVKMWTAGLHGGARLPMGGASVITPYLNLDYVHAKMDGFTEAGLSGADLTLDGATTKRTFLTGGVKWATQMGGVVPEVNLGYRYRFGDARSTFAAQFFDGSSATDCWFDVASAAQKRGTFLAGLSVGGKMGPLDLRVGYEGEFNGSVTSHSGNFKLVLPLGGHAAPPPPAPVVAPPPPPPAPVVEQPAPPPPPPPPPAPVERGERGQ